MSRLYHIVVSVWAAAFIGACAPWARGPQLSPAASGLVGEWVGPVAPGSGDTTVWRFTAAGTSEQERIRSSHKPQRTPFGSFRVHADTGQVRLICFSFRRSRYRAGCRYFQVEAPGEMRRRLKLLNWVGEKQQSAETWIERTP